jgi:hypothetical protein
MKWKESELKYLRENYSSKKVSFKDLIKKLGRTKRAISHKGARLGLSRPRIPINKPKDPKHRRIYDRKYYDIHKKRIYKRKKRRTRKIKLELIELLGGKCSMCKYKKCPAALDFHHVGSKKEQNIAKIIGDSSKQKALKEVKKCILVCANCHRELHYKSGA